jgi:hypothetical protein
MVNDMNIFQRPQREKEGGREHAKEGGKSIDYFANILPKNLEIMAK